MKIQVVQGRRYAAGVKVPFWLPDNVLGTNLYKSEALGWTNAISYEAGADPLNIPEGDHTHVIIATRSGPTEVVDTDLPPYAGYVVWVKDTYPDMPMPTDPKAPPGLPQPAPSGGASSPSSPLLTPSPAVVAAGGVIAVAGLVGVLFLASFARW